MPVAPSVSVANGARIFHPDLVNMYGCSLGAESTVGPFVEIQANVVIGARCKISSHCFLCDGVTIEDEVFVGHGVMFTNDRFPRATRDDGTPATAADWTLETTRVGARVSIGSGAVILPGISIGKGALVGAGAVVSRDVPDFAIVAGNPAKVVGDTRGRS